jgi:hypothetical protein
MPSVAPKKAKPIPGREELVAILAEVMSAPGKIRQPQVIWNPMPIEGKLNVIVIWGRWRGISFEERTSIILEACERHKEGLREKIYMAIGRTPDEAISLGYLPVRIAPVNHRIKDGDGGRVDEALIEEGAVETETGLQLRFASIDEAQDAFLRLQEKTPGPYWMIIEEVAKEY